MKKSEVAGLLAAASAFDNRRVTPEQVEAWHSLFVELDPADTMEAMKRHFRSSREYLMPVHIVEGVQAILQERHWAGPQLTTEEHRLCVAAGVSPEEYEDRRDDPGFDEWVDHLRQRTGLAVGA